jgi:amidase
MKAGLTDKKYIKAVKKSHLGSKQIIDKVITINKLDAICGLTMGPACSIDMIYGDRWEMFFNNTCSSEWLSILLCLVGRFMILPVGFSFLDQLILSLN